MKLDINRYVSNEITLRGAKMTRYYNVYEKKIDFTMPLYMFTNNLMIFSR